MRERNRKDIYWYKSFQINSFKKSETLLNVSGEPNISCHKPFRQAGKKLVLGFLGQTGGVPKRLLFSYD